MSDITVVFRNQPPIHIELYNTTAARIWKSMFVENYQRQFPLFRDMQAYSWEYLEQLIQQANQVCGWNYQTKIQSMQDTVALHKHLEVTLAQGFEHVPATWDHILHELHLAIHKIQSGGHTRSAHRGRFLQVEWFNNDWVPLPEDFEFSPTYQFGSIRLQNAYVGHQPLMIFQQNDNANVFQTCRFHDRILPGLHIITVEPTAPVDQDKYRYWWHKNAPEFVAHHGWDRIAYYSGHALIGQVLNIEDLRTVLSCPDILELQKVLY